MAKSRNILKFVPMILVAALLAGTANAFSSAALAWSPQQHMAMWPTSLLRALPRGRQYISGVSGPRQSVHMSSAAMIDTKMARQTVMENMEQICATYCLLWQPEGDMYVVKKDYTTKARIAAMRKARGDDKLFATESRRFSVPAKGRGPISLAASSGKQVTITDTSRFVFFDRSTSVCKCISTWRVHIRRPGFEE